MLIHVLRTTVATAAITLGTFLPFLPGRYDRLAISLSIMSQIAGIGGLLLVPVGAGWIASRYSKRLAATARPFAATALAVSSFVWLIVSVGALASGGTILGLASFTAGIVVAWKLASRLRRRFDATSESVRA